MNRLGVGIITCNRPQFFEKCLKSVLFCAAHDDLVIVNDGTPYGEALYKLAPDAKVIQHEKNTGVGISKNDAIQYLYDKGCDDIFLIEDDIFITDPAVFTAYIVTSKLTGIEHLMFGYHGPANKVSGVPRPRLKVMYTEGYGLALNQHCVGAFCYYTRKVIEQVGLNDVNLVNAFEHVEHTYRIWKEAKLTTPFWWFADMYDSYNYLNEQACSEVSSVIRPRSDWQSNIQNAASYYTRKHGFGPVQTPDHTQEQIVEFLKERKEHNNTMEFIRSNKMLKQI